jgi:hypothetical protein
LTAEDESFSDPSAGLQDFPAREPSLLITSDLSAALEQIPRFDQLNWQVISLTQKSVNPADIYRVAGLRSVIRLEIGSLHNLDWLYRESLQAPNLLSLDLAGSYPTPQQIFKLKNLNPELENFSFGFWHDELEADRGQWLELTSAMPNSLIEHDFDIIQKRWGELAAQLRGSLISQSPEFEGYELKGPIIEFTSMSRKMLLAASYRSDFEVVDVTISTELVNPRRHEFSIVCERSNKSILSTGVEALVAIFNGKKFNSKTKLNWAKGDISFQSDSEELNAMLLKQWHFSNKLAEINFCGPEFAYWVITLKDDSLKFQLGFADFQMRRASNKKIAAIVDGLNSLVSLLAEFEITPALET